MNKKFGALAVALLGTLAIAGVASAEDGAIRVNEAWARATPGGARTGAVYLTVTNAGTTLDTITGVSTPAADKAELHQMKIENGIMEMRPVPALAVPPGQSLTLGPNGYHVMLTGLRAPLKEGGTVPLTLTFEHAGPVSVTASIAKVGAMHAGEMSAMPGMSMPGMAH